MYTIYILVRDKDGYEVISNIGLWGCVVEGLNIKFDLRVKLIYVKDLNLID